MKFVILSALFSTSAAQTWTYKSNGSDWSANYPTCALKNQSPINLSTAPDASYRKYDAAEDNFI